MTQHETACLASQTQRPIADGCRVWIRLPWQDYEPVPILIQGTVEVAVHYTDNRGVKSAAVQFDDGRNNVMPHYRLTVIPKYRSIDD